MFRIGQVPVTVTGLVILLEVIGMLVVVALPGAMKHLVYFTPSDFLSGSVWQAVSYPFFEPPSIWLLIGLYFFYLFGSQVENALDRSSYVRLLVAVTLTPPVVVTLAHLLSVPGSLLGSHLPHLAIFVAAIAMMPNAPSAFFGFPIKWFAVAFIGLALLQFLMGRNFGACLALVSVIYLAIWWMRQAGHVSQWGVVEDVMGPRASARRQSRRSTGKRRSLGKKQVYEKKLKPRTKLTTSRRSKDIDRILDKISEEGLHSLSEDERKLLQEASKK